MMNITCYDSDLDPMIVKIYGRYENDAEYAVNLLHQAYGVVNGSTLTYNWTSPLVQANDPSLMLLFHFDNRSEYGENNNRVHDFSGQGNNGTIGGSEVELATSGGYFGGGIMFNGQPSNNLTINPSRFNDLDAGTISLWFKYVQTPNNAGELMLPLLFFGNSSTSTRNGMLIEIGHMTDTFHVGRENTTQIFYTINGDGEEPVFCFDSTINLTNGSWYNYVVTVNDTGNTGYLNGAEITNRTYNFGDSNDSVFFSNVSFEDTFMLGGGKFYGDSSWYQFNGTIDEVAIWNRSLSAQEVQDLYQLKTGTYYWRISVSDRTDEVNTTNEFILYDPSSYVSCDQVLPVNTTLTRDYNCGGTPFRIQEGSTILDCTGHTLTGNGSGYGVNISGVDKVTIKNCVIEGFQRGISIFQSDNCTLLNNTVSNNTYGIVIQRSMINTLANNTVTNNQWHGLYADNKSRGTMIDGNTFCSNNQADGGYYDLYNAAPTMDVPVHPKIFERPGLDIKPYNETTMLAGGIIFDHGFNATHIKENRVFKSFGLYFGADDEYGPQPDFVYLLDTNATIYSPINGTIERIAWTHAGDWGIMIFPEGYGMGEYLMGIDHVLNVTVSVGDNVTAGQPIAKPGYINSFNVSWGNDEFHEGQQYGLTEFGIVQDNYVICQTRFYTDELLASFNASITRLMSDWEEFIGDESVHNESAFVLPGCLGLEYPVIMTNQSNSGTDNTCDSVYSYNDTNTSSCTSTCSALESTTTTVSTTSTTTSTTVSTVTTITTSTTLTTTTSTTPTTTSSVTTITGSTTSTTLAGNQSHYSIQLHAGWNLVSLPGSGEEGGFETPYETLNFSEVPGLGGPSFTINDELYTIFGSNINKYVDGGFETMYDTGSSGLICIESYNVEVVGTKAYVLGGLKRTQEGCYNESGSADDVWEYDSSNNSFSKATSMNYGREVMGSGVVDGRLYVLGGWDTFNNTAGLNTAEVEVFENGTWTVINYSGVYYPVRSPAYAAVGSRIYLFGGCVNGDLEYAHPCNMQLVQIFDTTSNKFSQGGLMILSGRHFSGQHATVRGNYTYVFGGSIGFSCEIYDDVAVYDTTADAWRLLDSTMTIERKSIGSAVVGNQLFIFGGQSCNPAGECPGIHEPGTIPNCPIRGAGTTEVGTFTSQ